jgi:hypothetical protein
MLQFLKKAPKLYNLLAIFKRKGFSNVQRLLCLSVLASLLLASCKTAPKPPPQASAANFGAPGTPAPRAGDEIMICGQLFHTGAPVVLWTDAGGYDAYRTDRRFAPYDKASFEATTQEAGDA